MPANYLPVPQLEQSAEGDCLPTCIAMILAYLHEPVDVTRIARLLDIQEFGSVASRIHRLAEWNYEVTYQSGSLARLRACIDAAIPVIAFVWTGDLPYWSINTPHAIVVIGVNDETV